MYARPAFFQTPRGALTIKVVVVLFVFIILFNLLSGSEHIQNFIPRPSSIPSFIAHGETKCLPSINDTLIKQSVDLHSECRKLSPFNTYRARIATVTAHFGEPKEHYKQAFQTHLLHSLIHGTELHAMCDPIVDDLWNKPAFILSILLAEMEKPAEKRLEWLFWADRDTLIMDQCRPTSSFLPPEPSRFGNYLRLPYAISPSGDEAKEPPKEVNLIVSNDLNGLNNGVFFLRVGNWAIDMFTDILAFRDYKPDVDLPFTEQSAMEKVLNETKFFSQTQLVPQSWFNAYPSGGPDDYEQRTDAGLQDIEDFHLRRGDWLLHFAGEGNKGEVIPRWINYLNRVPHPWSEGVRDKLQRLATDDVARWWANLGY